MAVIDETGNVYGRLTVTKRAENGKNGRAFWQCECSCGNSTVVMGKYLRSGETKSCGCLKKESYKYAAESNIKRNPYICDSVYAHVFFHNSDKEMICDLSSWAKAKKYTWHVTEHGYARGYVEDRLVLFHDFIMNFIPHDNFEIDHKNRNRLDNRLSNLRIVSSEVNAQNKSPRKNSSGYTGVYQNGNKWHVYFKSKHIGSFYTKEEAVAKRKELEEKHYKNIKFEYMDDFNNELYDDYYIGDDDEIYNKITGERVKQWEEYQ